MTLRERRRALMQEKSGGRLPAGYQEVEWISGTYNAFIATQIKPYRTTAFIDFEITGFQQSASFFGCWNADNERYYGFRIVGNNLSSMRMAFVTRYNGNNEFASPGTSRHTAVFNGTNGDILYDGAIVANSTLLDLTKQAGNAIRIFGFNGGTAQNYPKIRIYRISFTDKDGGNVLGDFIPCYRKSDGEIGMYDIVTEQFFQNDDTSGTGTFTKGADV